MAWNGSGVFSRTNGTHSGSTSWEQDRVAGDYIIATRHDTHDEDLATGIQACLTKNGESKATANFAPNADASYDLGTSSLKWRAAYLSGALHCGKTSSYRASFGDGAGSEVIEIDGGTSGASGGPALYLSYGGSVVHGIGAYSAIVGGAFDDRLFIYGGGKVIAMSASGTTSRWSLATTGAVTMTIDAAVYGTLVVNSSGASGSNYATFTNTTDSKSAFFGVDGNGFVGANAGAATMASSTGEPCILAPGLTARIFVESDGRLYGNALHNNAGAITGTTNQYIASGTYTPTISNTSNVTSSTANVCQWMRVGNVVTVSGKVLIDATGAGATSFDASLPIASSFTVDYQCAGTALYSNGATTFVPCFVSGEQTNDDAYFNFVATGASSGERALFFTYTYVIV